MTDFLIGFFVRDHENVNDPKVRESYGKLSGTVGIFLNILLSISKVVIGYLSATISIVADGFNNISDAASSLITLLGFKLSGKPADREHPFGHARFEYISGMVISFFIMIIGVNLFLTSVKKIISPDELNVSYASFAVLGISIIIKLWMCLFNKKLGNKINSKTLLAAAQDSINDVFSTGAVLLCVIFAGITGINIDPYAGVGVSIFIIYNGLKLVIDTLNPLLGQKPTDELYEYIINKVKSYDGILGVHDLIIHDYGPGRRFASIHIEVDRKVDIMISHELSDEIERDFVSDGIEMVVHLDPIVTDDEEINSLKTITKKCVEELNLNLHIHDFRTVKGPNKTNLIFDVVVPFECVYSENQIREMISDKIKSVNENYYAVINIDRE